MDYSDRRKRHPDEARSKLERWILEAGGPSKAGLLIGVHYVTVNTWISRRATPSLQAACRMIDLSKGELTAHDILEGSSC